MAHPEFKHIGNPLDRLIEECAEFLKAIIKIKRFGFKSYNPYDKNKIMNITKLIAEFYDVQNVYREVLFLWEKEQNENG